MKEQKEKELEDKLISMKADFCWAILEPIIIGVVILFFYKNLPKKQDLIFYVTLILFGFSYGLIHIRDAKKKWQKEFNEEED